MSIFNEMKKAYQAPVVETVDIVCEYLLQPGSPQGSINRNAVMNDNDFASRRGSIEDDGE